MNLSNFTFKWLSSPRHRYCSLCGKFIDEKFPLARRYVEETGKKRLADPREFICKECAMETYGMSEPVPICKQSAFSFDEADEFQDPINPTPTNRHGLDPSDLYHEDEPLSEDVPRDEAKSKEVGIKDDSEPPPWD